MKLKIELNFGIFKSKLPKCRDFVKSGRSSIVQMQSHACFATLRNYNTALNSFEAFAEAKHLDGTRLSSRVLLQYQDWLHQRSVCINTSANYMRYLRALYNMQRDCHDASPFDKVVTANAATVKRSLSADDICKIRNLNLDADDTLSLYRDVFLFSIYTFGIPFIDLFRLRHSDLKNGVLAYNRQKTNKAVVVVVLPEAQQILDRHRSADSDYLFPEICRHDGYKAYQQQLAKYNNALRRLTELSGTDVALTSYVARHTWASLAYSRGIDIGIISQALGHTNLRTTQIYLRELDVEKLRSAGAEVIGTIC